MATPGYTLRVDAELESAARRAAPELAQVNVATLARVGLAVLAGLSMREAVKRAQAKPGPKPRTGAAA